jgi:hypothetical protein
MELRLTLIDADDGLVRGWRLLSPGRLGAPDALAEVDVDYRPGIRWPGWCGAAVLRSGRAHRALRAD